MTTTHVCKGVEDPRPNATKNVVLQKDAKVRPDPDPWVPTCISADILWSEGGIPHPRRSLPGPGKTCPALDLRIGGQGVYGSANDGGGCS